MSLSAQLVALFDAPLATPEASQLTVCLAASEEEVRAAQRLRYQVFVEEMGARLTDGEPGIETDAFDPFCQHLLVKDGETVVGCYRLLTDTQADRAGGYYSQAEFDLSRILAIPGRFMEIGRTCVHPAYRTGSTIALLWSGLARFMVMNRIDYLMGCASIPLRTGTREATLIYQRLARQHLGPEAWRVFPRVPLPQVNLTDADEKPQVPALIKGYLRAGAVICGEPAWDPQFNVADLFILLRADEVSGRYARHFMQRA
jgi:putative hemolysin